MSQDNIDWRNVIYRVTVRLVSNMTTRGDFRRSHLPTVLIAYDSDLPKTGRRMELIGKIFSHVHQRCILGYKALMLCWSDGRTQFMLDASLHGEKGMTVMPGKRNLSCSSAACVKTRNGESCSPPTPHSILYMHTRYMQCAGP